ncbi:MAG: hypothetical protein AB7L91_17175 [Dehalococcoidia bacterium]
MQATEEPKKKAKRREVLNAASALSLPISHPLRVRILEVVNERDMSPSDFVSANLFPPEMSKGRSEQNQLSMAAYHFRGLLKAGCVEIVGERQVRGATEHTYRGRAVAYFSDAQWAELDPAQRVAISRTMYQGMVARIESAMLAETFDSRDDRMLAWTPLMLDGRGWSELARTLAACFAEVEQIKVDSRNRIAAEDVAAFPATFAILGFESPAGAPTVD